MHSGLLNGTRNVLCRSSGALFQTHTVTSCRRLHGARRTGSRPTDSTTEERSIVTTPLFSAAHEPHIGHLHTLVIADILKRWNDLKEPKNGSILFTGINASGIKVLDSATASGQNAQGAVNQNIAAYRQLIRRANIGDHEFVSVPKLHQQQAVQHAWMLFRDAGLIYERKFEGYYSIEDDCFYSHEEVRFALNPRTGQKHIVAEMSGSEVQQISEKVWFFRLSALQGDVLKLYDEGVITIEPGIVRQDVVDALAGGILDCPISRPASVHKNGSPVPGEEKEQIIHVWLDALFSFLCNCGWPDWRPGTERSTGWPAAIHVVGEEFASVYGIRWPAMLLGAGQPVPRKILCHGQWTISNKPMKKKLGNLVNPFSALRRFESDAVRYYLAREGPRQMSSDWNNEDLARVWNTHLRQFEAIYAYICTPAFDSTQVITRAHQVRSSKPSISKLRAKLRQSAADVDASMARLDVPEAVAKISALMTDAAQTIASHNPWLLLSEVQSKGASKEYLDDVLYTGIETMRICAILALPIVPVQASSILDSLGVRPTKRNLSAAVPGGDDAYGLPLSRPDADSSMKLFTPLKNYD